MTTTCLTICASASDSVFRTANETVATLAGLRSAAYDLVNARAAAASRPDLGSTAANLGRAETAVAAAAARSLTPAVDAMEAACEARRVVDHAWDSASVLKEDDPRRLSFLRAAKILREAAREAGDVIHFAREAAAAALAGDFDGVEAAVGMAVETLAAAEARRERV